MKVIAGLLALVLAAIVLAAATVWSGVYNVAADDPHWPATYRLLEVGRARSIAAHAAEIEVPDLSDPELIRSGAGNYNAMCVTCHLAPGVESTELSTGLYPQPPRWNALAKTEPREAFWVLKHGIKASGMPAWGRSMDDQYLWGMVAFIQQFPAMTVDAYRAQVSASPGHSHGGGETGADDSDHATPPPSSPEVVEELPRPNDPADHDHSTHQH